MEISLFEVDTPSIYTFHFCYAVGVRAQRVCLQEVSSCSGACLLKVPITWLWVSSLLMGALGKCFFWGEEAPEAQLGKNPNPCCPRAASWELSMPDHLRAWASVHVNTEPIRGTSDQITGSSPSFKHI